MRQTEILLDDGSPCELVCPAEWNGYLVSQPDLMNDPVDVAFQSWLAAKGCGSVRHSRDVRGWDLSRGIANHAEAVCAFSDLFGVPPRGTIVMGGSMGGVLARLLVEREPDAFIGSLPTDGGGAGVLAAFVRGLDMAFVVSHLLGGDRPLALAQAPSVDGKITALGYMIERGRESAAGRTARVGSHDRFRAHLVRSGPGGAV
ncbi:hypothetical protein [Amycolatopsis dongchuanensis]|uniref:Alpha/beta hydrolase n=1 Tax=Amycolatopsis dongchuanensis TaxID=1070866 RepID=A0ABP8VHB7_9PSEU